jgi:hypothetical protein
MLRKIALALLILGHPAEAFAGEFGNLFVPSDPELEEASREASAEALDAIIEVMSGLRARELREGDGKEQIQVASQQLFNAMQKMRALTEEENFPNFEIPESEKDLLAQTIGIETYRAFFGDTQDFRDAFLRLIEIGEILASSVQEDDRMLSVFSKHLANFILAGDAIAALGKRTL